MENTIKFSGKFRAPQANKKSIGLVCVGVSRMNPQDKPHFECKNRSIDVTPKEMRIKIERAKQIKPRALRNGAMTLRNVRRQLEMMLERERERESFSI